MRWFDRILAYLDDGDTRAAAAKIRGFETLLVVLCATEVWKTAIELHHAGAAFGWLLPSFVTVSGAVACTRAWRGQGFLLLTLGMVGAVWNMFPTTGNHVYLECFLCGLCALLDTSQKEQQRLLIGSLRWVSCVIMFFAGIQKLVHGYYTTGLMPAFLLQEHRFEGILGLLAPAAEAQRILSYNGLTGSGPYFVSSPLWLLASNLIWMAEIALAVALFLPATRRAAVLAGVAFVVLIETGAREILFGLLYVNLLLMFVPHDVHRRYVPAAVVVCVLIILIRLGVLPAVEVH